MKMIFAFCMNDYSQITNKRIQSEFNCRVENLVKVVVVVVVLSRGGG